jgi:hypothetical protein
MALLSAAALALLCRPALADDRAQAREHFVRGTRAFDLAQYEEAIAEYMAAYKLRDDPALLYNIAQAHRLAGHLADAVWFYKSYQNRNPKTANRDEIESRIRELDRLVEAQKRAQQRAPTSVESPPPSSAPPAPLLHDPEPAPPEPARASAASVAPSVTTAPPARCGQCIAGIATGSAGVALLIPGIAFGALAAQLADQIRKQQMFDPQKDDRLKTYQALEGVFSVSDPPRWSPGRWSRCSPIDGAPRRGSRWRRIGPRIKPVWRSPAISEDSMRRVSILCLLLGGCYGDLYKSGVTACSTDQRCPSGFYCARDLKCWSHGKGPDMGPPGDGGVDQGPQLPQPIWLSSGGASATGKTGTQVNLSFGGQPVFGSATSQSGAVVTFGTFSSDTITDTGGTK